MQSSILPWIRMLLMFLGIARLLLQSMEIQQETLSSSSYSLYLQNTKPWETIHAKSFTLEQTSPSRKRDTSAEITLIYVWPLGSTSYPGNCLIAASASSLRWMRSAKNVKNTLLGRPRLYPLIKCCASLSLRVWQQQPSSTSSNKFTFFDQLFAALSKVKAMAVDAFLQPDGYWWPCMSLSRFWSFYTLCLMWRTRITCETMTEIFSNIQHFISLQFCVETRTNIFLIVWWQFRSFVTEEIEFILWFSTRIPSCCTYAVTR